LKEQSILAKFLDDITRALGTCWWSKNKEKKRKEKEKKREKKRKKRERKEKEKIQTSNISARI